MRENQKLCNHKWEASIEKGYSVCHACGLMRDDKDGDLFDSQNPEEWGKVSVVSVLKRFKYWLEAKKK